MTSSAPTSARPTPIAAAAGWAFAGALVAGASLFAAPDAHGALGAAAGLLMLAIAREDARRFAVPDAFTAPAFAFGAAEAYISAGREGLLVSIFGAALVAGGLFAVRTVYLRLRGREGLGLGDIKLAAVAGVWLDPTAAALAIEIAALAALAFHWLRISRRRRVWRAAARLPFGAAFGPAIWLVWLLETGFSR